MKSSPLGNRLKQLCDVFIYRFSLHIQEKDEMELRPVFTEDGITFIYIKVSDFD